MGLYLLSPQSNSVYNQQEASLKMKLFSTIHKLPGTGKRKLDFEYERTRAVNFQQIKVLSASFGCASEHSKN